MFLKICCFYCNFSVLVRCVLYMAACCLSREYSKEFQNIKQIIQLTGLSCWRIKVVNNAKIGILNAPKI